MPESICRLAAATPWKIRLEFIVSVEENWCWKFRYGSVRAASCGQYEWDKLFSTFPICSWTVASSWWRSRSRKTWIQVWDPEYFLSLHALGNQRVVKPKTSGLFHFEFSLNKQHNSRLSDCYHIAVSGSLYRNSNSWNSFKVINIKAGLGKSGKCSYFLYFKNLPQLNTIFHAQVYLTRWSPSSLPPQWC